MKTLLAYLQLLRLPNVFTAMADIFMGFLISHGTLDPWTEIAPLLVASSCIYLSGMVLNDWFDIEVDRIERPERPLPSGRVPRSHALIAGIGLLVVGVTAAIIAGGTSRNVALLLVVAVLLYDGVVKNTMLGPAVMGLCRTLNVLLGMSTVAGAIWIPSIADPPQAFRLGTMIAAGIGLYTMGVTRFARNEATGLPMNPLSATLGFNLGLLLIAFAGHASQQLGIVIVDAESPYWIRCLSDPKAFDATTRFYTASAIWLVAVAAINFMVMRGVIDGEPKKVQQAVKTCILALIGIDAAAVALFCGPVWAAGVLALLVPTLTLGRWVYST